MTNKKLLFIWNYHYFPFEKGKSRFSDLLDAFVKEGYQVEVVTSSFYHMGKVQRSIEDPKYQSLGYNVHFISEPGYKKNVSFARVRSMNRFNAGVKHFLKNHEPVDVVYVPVPSIKLAAIAEKWCRLTKAKCVIDVEDLWPESFQMIIKGKAFYHALTWPLKSQADKVYRNADAVVAVSQTYMDRVKQVRKGAFPNAVAPIGADVDYVHSIVNKTTIVKPDGEFWISYIGTFGKSYDLKTLIDTVSSLNQAYFSNIHLKLLGSGPEEAELKRYAAKSRGNIDFVGLLPYDQMCQHLAVSDLGVNPIVGNSVASLINKVADYAACSLPVLNTQLCPEYQKILSDCHAGINVENGSSIALQKAILICLKNPLKLAELKKGAYELSLHYLSRAKSQSDILALIASIYGTESQK
ncbi:MAG: putative glycosyl transferase [bacterium ADurb.BinA186]|nr:MAG: putative glycosyl transferase [bacterium ADurb.BinA186]